jgi:hypothetical protein
MCWGNWDGKVAECKACSIAERCSESTKRIQRDAPPESPIAKPKEVTKPEAVKETKPEVSKPEVAKETKPEAKPEEVKADRSEPVSEIPARITVESLTESVKSLFGNDVTVLVKEGEKFTICSFTDANGQKIVKVGITKDGKQARMQKTEKACSIECGYSAADFAEAIKSL